MGRKKKHKLKKIKNKKEDEKEDEKKEEFDDILDIQDKDIHCHDVIWDTYQNMVNYASSHNLPLCELFTCNIVDKFMLFVDDQFR